MTIHCNRWYAFSIDVKDVKGVWRLALRTNWTSRLLTSTNRDKIIALGADRTREINGRSLVEEKRKAIEDERRRVKEELHNKYRDPLGDIGLDSYDGAVQNGELVVSVDIKINGLSIKLLEIMKEAGLLYIPEGSEPSKHVVED